MIAGIVLASDPAIYPAGNEALAHRWREHGNPQPGPKFVYKLAWFERLIKHSAELISTGLPVVLAGDYNVVPTHNDIYPTRSLDNNALIQAQSRDAYARLLSQGWTDALRALQPDGPLWTFWDYERGRWAADKGMRLDHILSGGKWKRSGRHLPLPRCSVPGHRQDHRAGSSA